MNGNREERTEKRYTKAVIHTTTQGAEALSPMLERFGIDAVSVEDPADLAFIRATAGTLYDYIDESLGAAEAAGEARVTFYLPPLPDDATATDNRNHDAFLEELRIELMRLKAAEQYGDFGPDADFGRLWMEIGEVKDDWSDRYKEVFHMFSPCPGVRIRPPWEPEAAEGSDLEIVIDPGMAFGTGTHETTSLCLDRLMRIWKPRDTMLDAGTGSGILAIAAALLGKNAGEAPGSPDIIAVEVDPDAIASARENIRGNDCGDRIRLIEADVLSDDSFGGAEESKFSIITANLTKSLLLKLLPRFDSLLAPEGILLLSGLLDAQADAVADALRAQGFSNIKTHRKGEWALLEAYRNA